jgi:chromosome partitioning protein
VSPRKHRVICVASTKGGVGKSTTATSLSSVLASVYKQSTVLLDCDPQGSSTKMLGADVNLPGTAEFILNSGEVVEQKIDENLCLLAGSPKLSSPDIANLPSDFLRDALEGGGDTYVIDSSNQSFHLMNLSFLAATHVIAVSDRSTEGFNGARNIINHVNTINARKKGKKIQLILLLNLHKAKTERSKLRLEDAKQYADIPIFCLDEEEDLAKAAEVFEPICRWSSNKRKKYFQTYKEIIEEVFV